MSSFQKWERRRSKVVHLKSSKKISITLWIKLFAHFNIQILWVTEYGCQMFHFEICLTISVRKLDGGGGGQRIYRHNVNSPKRQHFQSLNHWLSYSIPPSSTGWLDSCCHRNKNYQKLNKNRMKDRKRETEEASTLRLLYI